MGFYLADEQSHQQDQVDDQGAGEKQVDPEILHFPVAEEVDQDQEQQIMNYWVEFYKS